MKKRDHKGKDLELDSSSWVWIYLKINGQMLLKDGGLDAKSVFGRTWMYKCDKAGCNEMGLQLKYHRHS
jgi:hypothetical protein